MSSMNQVFLMGNLTRDPVSRTTPAGMAVSELGLAISDNYRDKQGQSVDRTCFADIVVWGRQAETCQQFLKKGSPVIVEGKLQFDAWQTETGEKRSKLRIKAHRIQFMGKATTALETATSTEVEPSF